MWVSSQTEGISLAQECRQFIPRYPALDPREVILLRAAPMWGGTGLLELIQGQARWDPRQPGTGICTQRGFPSPHGYTAEFSLKEVSSGLLDLEQLPQTDEMKQWGWIVELRNRGLAKSFPHISSFFPWLRSFQCARKWADREYIAVTRLLSVT